MGQTPAHPDMIAVPDPASYTLVPWQPGLAVLQCDISVEGELWPYSPRVILKRMLKRAEERGLVYNVGCEAEYSLVRRLPGGGIEVADPLDVAEAPCYDVKGLTRMYDHLTTVSKYLNRLGWANYANDHEDANGQFEQNFAYADALTSADRLIFFRYMVHTLAHQAGMAATFMPKPFANLTGNGLHFHSSLWDAATGAELFANPDDPRGLGLSEMAYHYIGGLLEHATALVGVTCPTVNFLQANGRRGSRLRGRRGRLHTAPTAATTAPRCFVCQKAAGSRTAPVTGRQTLSRDGRSARGGLDGVDKGLDPGEPNLDNLYLLPAEAIHARGIRSMPPTLLHAMDELVADDVCRDAPRQDARRRLRGLLRQGKARGVPRMARSGERLGGGALPDALLGGAGAASGVARRRR